MEIEQDKEIMGEFIIIGGDTSNEGGFTSVVKSRHKSLGYTRGIRILHKEVSSVNDEDYKIFCAECKLLLRIGNAGHPNIVRLISPPQIQEIKEVGKAATTKIAFAEMEWVKGKDVDFYINHITCTARHHQRRARHVLEGLPSGLFLEQLSRGDACAHDRSFRTRGSRSR